MFEWEGLDRLREEVNRMFDRTILENGGTREFPPVNIWMSDDDVLIRAELPGLGAGSIEVSMLGNVLTLRGARKAEALGEKAELLRDERWERAFARSIELPIAVDAQKAQATCERGVLSVRMPRAASEKPRAIPVKQA